MVNRLNRIAFQLPYIAVSSFIDIVKALPSADRPQGEWIDKGYYAECSICGGKSGTQFDGVQPIPLKTKYCPDCGSRMKGGDSNEQ